MSLPENALQQAKQSVAMVAVGETGLSLADLSTVFVKSGFFKDVREQSQAIVKILLGQELGLKPIQSMMGIHIVEGKPEVSAALMAALVKRSGRYDYKVVVHTDEGCGIEFYALADPGPVLLGTSSFSMADARKAGLADRQNWKHYPRNMCFARALSNGVKWYCGDALGGLPVYADQELTDAGLGTSSNGRTVDRATGEVLSEPPAASLEEPNPYMPQAKTSEVEGSTPSVASTVAEFDSPQDGERGGGPAAAARGAAGKATTKTKDSKTSPGKAVRVPSPEPVRQDEAPSDQAATAASAPPLQAGDAPPPADDAHHVVFTIGNKHYATAGMTREQMASSFELAVAADKLFAKGYARGKLATIMGIHPNDVNRTNATEAQAAIWLRELAQDIEKKRAEGA